MALKRPTLTSNSGFVSPCGRAVASPPWRRGPQVRTPWRHGGHGVVDVVGPVAPPGRTSSRGDAGVYTDWRKWPLGAVLGHSCTLLRRESCVGWHERPSRHGVPAAAPRWPAPPLAGKTGSARVAPPLGWRFHRGVSPHKPPKSRQICRFRDRLGPRSHHARAHELWHGQLHRMGEGMLRVASGIRDPALSRSLC